MKTKIGVFTFVLAGMLLGGIAQAKGASCSIPQSDFDKLISIQNNISLDYLTEIKLELGVRKDILKTTVDCAIDEANTLKSAVEGVAVSDGKATDVRAKLSNELDNAVNYYKTERAKIDDLGLQGSKDFAGNLASWRRGNYKTVADTAQNFLLWESNQQMFQKAQDRMDQLGQTVTLLKLVYAGDVQMLWNETQKQFTEAKNLNQNAVNDLETTSADASLTTIKASLDSLAKTYERLSDLIGDINKALSLPN